jgi:hypothetical protein
MFPMGGIYGKMDWFCKTPTSRGLKGVCGHKDDDHEGTLWTQGANSRPDDPKPLQPCMVTNCECDTFRPMDLVEEIAFFAE